mmetsp:Transcript_36964/g.82809  ORF Transcript_36964/g.82809 Transcript_36964/m.82809 type:complete len:259 (-) Transcript_36964:213-989(-)
MRATSCLRWSRAQRPRPNTEEGSHVSLRKDAWSEGPGPLGCPLEARRGGGGVSSSVVATQGGLGRVDSRSLALMAQTRSRCGAPGSRAGMVAWSNLVVRTVLQSLALTDEHCSTRYLTCAAPEGPARRSACAARNTSALMSPMVKSLPSVLRASASETAFEKCSWSGPERVLVRFRKSSTRPSHTWREKSASTIMSRSTACPSSRSGSAPHRPCSRPATTPATSGSCPPQRRVTEVGVRAWRTGRMGREGRVVKVSHV